MYNIALVDDNKEFLNVYKTVLEHEIKNVTVHTFDCPHKFLIKSEDEKFTMVISDLNMESNINGLEFVSLIKEKDKDIKTALISGDYHSVSEQKLENVDLIIDKLDPNIASLTKFVNCLVKSEMLK